MPVDDLDFDLLAAALRADSQDLRSFLEALAVKLEQALPRAATIRRGRQGLTGPRVVKQISVDLADQRLELSRNGDSIEAARARVSGGIVLKTERLEIDAWIQALTEALGDEARRSQQTRQALARLLDG